MDPAVLDALEDFGRGNPPLSLGLGTPRGARHVALAQPVAEPSRARGRLGPDDSGAPADARPRTTPSDEARARVGHGAADVPERRARRRAAVDAVRRPGRRGRRPQPSQPAHPGTALSARRMTARGLGAVPAVAPPDALFDPALLGGVDVDTLFLLGDGGRTTCPPYLRLPTGQPLVLTDERASSGGPPRPAPPSRSPCASGSWPRRPWTSTNLRPIVVRFPMRWEPGAHLAGGRLLRRVGQEVDPAGAADRRGSDDLRRQARLRQGAARRRGRPGQHRRHPHPGPHRRHARTTCSPTPTRCATG